MERVLEPLRAMGVDARATDGHLPVALARAERLASIDWKSPVASAQVKSAILLAALGAQGRTTVHEPRPTRDHTERMLAAFGVAVASEPDGAGGVSVSLDGPATLKGTRIDVPADPSSAAFLAAAALTAPGSRVELADVMANPRRDGFLRALVAMGARASAGPVRTDSGEAVCDWTIEHAPLAPVSPPTEDAASMIDEYPVLAVLAAFADGESRFEGVGELRVKESDRIAATVAMLRVNGVDAEELEDGFVVRGRGPRSVAGGGRVETRHDHRIAMSALVLGLGAKAPVEIDDASMIATSYPEFFDHMAALGAQMETGA
jgi:3-phosphoshikimate 1-carboxyvinyltransferase